MKKVFAVFALLILVAASLPTSIALAAPPAVTGLSAAMQAAPFGVALTWTDVDLEIGYKVLRANAPGTEFTNITAPGNLPANSISFTDSTATPGVTYSYRVVAFDLVPDDSLPSNTVTITASLPVAPSGLVATQQAGPPQAVALAWSDNSNNEIGFRVDRATDVAFTQNLVQRVVAANQGAFTDIDVLPGATYSYRVAALSTGGASASSNTATITVDAAAGMVAGPVVPIPGFPDTTPPITSNGYPMFYQDILGTKLQMLPIGPENLAAGPIAGNAYSAEVGFGAEAFYYMADVANGFGLIEFALEAVWANAFEAPIPGDEMVMNRTRFRLDAALMGAATGETVDYTVQTPYGTFEFPGIVEDPLSNRDINFTLDVLGAAGQDFVTATTGPVNVFLRPTTAPAGAWGLHNGTTGTVTGAPGQITFVRITGSNGFDSGPLTSFGIFGRELTAAATPSFTKSVAPITGLAPAAVTFTDTTVGTPTSWAWDFGDGTSSSLQNPVKTYSTAGNFIVKLTAGNAGGSATASQMVSVFAVPVASFTTAGGATPLTVNFTSSTLGNPTGWLWDFGDGTNSTSQNPSKVFAAPGTYTVTLSVFNPAGSATASVPLAVNPLPVASFTATPVAPLTVSFADTSAGFPTGWAWDFGDGTNSTLQNFTKVYAAAGVFTVTLTVTNAGGSASAFKTITVTDTPPVPPSPTTLLTPANGAAVAGLTPTLSWNASATPGSAYDVQVSTAADPLFLRPVTTATGIAATSFDVPPGGVLSAATVYRWRVRATNFSGTSAWTLSRLFRTPVGPPPPRPLAPRGIIANLTPTLEWSATTGAISYDVEVSPNRLFADIVAGGAALVTTTFDVPAGALQGTTMYFWRVRVNNDVGTSRWSGPGIFRTPFGPRVPPIPLAPRGIVNTLTPTLEWRILRDEATSFDVQLSTSVRFLEGTILMDVTGIPAPVFTPGVTATLGVPVATLSPGTIYYWRVRGVNEFGASVWRLGIFRTAAAIP